MGSRTGGGAICGSGPIHGFNSWRLTQILGVIMGSLRPILACVLPRGQAVENNPLFRLRLVTSRNARR